MDKKPTINLDHAKDTLCKNIMIYGYCKFKDKGCAFNHENRGAAAAGSAGNPEEPSNNSSTSLSSKSSATGDPKKKFKFSSPAFTPTSPAAQAVGALSNKFSKMSPGFAEMPAFVPTNGMADPGSPLVKSLKNVDDKKFNADTPAFTPAPTSFSAPSNELINPYSAAPLQNDVYYQPTSNFPLQYHLYAPAPPPHLQMPLEPYETNAETMFINNELRESLQRRNETLLQSYPRQSGLPDHVHVYHSLVPVEGSIESKPSKSFGHNTSLFKVYSNYDGNVYCLRRIEDVTLATDEALKRIKLWSEIKCANVVSVKEAFTTMAFDGDDLAVVYDFFPCSNTLIEQHLIRKIAGKLQPITEELLWSYMCQLTNALIHVHEKDLAVRSLDLSKIIVTNEGRIRLSGCGILDILDYDNDIVSLQRKDVALFAKTILDLAINTIAPNQRYGNEEQLITSLNFSAEFKTALRLLMSPTITLADFSKSISSRLFTMMNSLQNSNDYIEAQLSTELENARLVRLITKLGFINERPEYDNDPLWAENGERYPLKLFRDYVFHRSDETGKPIVDLSHVLTCLNKLDAGIDERILLVSRDEKTCIIVTYKEIRDLIDSAFRGLT